MAEAENTETTLRETVEQAFDQHLPAEAPSQPAPSDGKAQEAVSDAKAAAPSVERARDEKTGQFVATDKSAKKEETKAQDPAATEAPVAAPVKQHPKVPSSWKKDYHDHWGKLDPSLAEYILQREGEYAKGVSTYKQEWDRAKPLVDALGPYQDAIKSLGIDAPQFVSNLAAAHQNLARGTPEQKLSMFLKLANDYGVPVQQLFVQGQDGKLYFNPQVQPYQAQQQQRSAQQPVDVAQKVREEVAAVMGAQQIREFAEAKDGQGNQLHPHFEAVREEMALLLDAGKAQDLKDAYDKAIRLHDDIFQSEQEAKRKADEAARQEQQRRAVAAAKANSVSVRSATPSPSSAPKAKGSVRGALEDAFEQHVSTGRV